MRHLQPGAIGASHVLREADHAAGHQPEARGVALVRVLEQQLHPDAHAEQRHAGRRTLARDGAEPGRPERGRTRPEGADAGQHEALRRLRVLDAARAHHGDARPLERAFERPEVSDAVVEQDSQRRRGEADERTQRLDPVA